MYSANEEGGYDRPIVASRRTERIPGAMAALAAQATGAMPRGVCWHYCRPPVVRLKLESEARALAREVTAGS